MMFDTATAGFYRKLLSKLLRKDNAILINKEVKPANDGIIIAITVEGYISNKDYEGLLK